MLKTAYVAFGANMGDGESNVRAAYEALGRVPGVYTEGLSNMYITKPWGYADQPDFTNACGKVKTTLPPDALLGACLGIEAAMGRVRTIKNGPRVIDIDLLLFEDETRDTPFLKLPHPGITERTFVLRPLLDLAENGMVLGLDVAGALRRLTDRENAGISC